MKLTKAIHPDIPELEFSSASWPSDLASSLFHQNLDYKSINEDEGTLFGPALSAIKSGS